MIKKIDRNENVYIIATDVSGNPHKSFEMDFDDPRLDIIENAFYHIPGSVDFLLGIDSFIANNVYPNPCKTFRDVARLCRRQDDGTIKLYDSTWYVIDGKMFCDGKEFYEMYFFRIIENVSPTVILPDTISSLSDILFAPRSSANGGV